MQTTDVGHLFQTSQQLSDAATRERKTVAAECVGDPIKVSSKVLDLLVQGQDVWTAESGWQARRLDLNSGKTKMIYKGHKGPVTSVALHSVAGSKPWLALLTSSWDKSVRIWDANTGEVNCILEGHVDFVKSIVVLPTLPSILLSTSSDKTVRLWNLSALEHRERPPCIQVIKEHSRPVDSAAYCVPEDQSAISVWTADSMGVIKQWTVDEIISPNSVSPLRYIGDCDSHETSVSRLAVGDGVLWSASMDCTAKSHGQRSVILNHPSYVKSLLPYPNGLPFVLTGCEDENIRVWNSSEMEEGSAQLMSVVAGHCGQVTAMDVWIKDPGNDAKKSVVVVSGSLDGTIRRWTVQDILNPPQLDYGPAPSVEHNDLTMEEERELAELMSDED